MMRIVRDFEEIWLVDFEFKQPQGGIPKPLCMVARELRTRRLIRLWQDELFKCSTSPIPADPTALFVAYYASAEIGCYLALCWPVPTRILDLYAEFKCKTAGLPVPSGYSLLGALTYYGFDGIEKSEKDSMRQLALRGGPYTSGERTALLDYCQSDVDALARLLPKMLPDVDLPRALLRGRYMAAAARIERTGTPIDVSKLDTLRDNWDEIRIRLISAVDRGFGVYDGSTFKADRFANYLAREDIPWPRLTSGRLALDDKTFKAMVKTYPQLQPLRELRKTLSNLRLSELPVGRDGRNRSLLSCFGTKTGRNSPSAKKFVFGLPSWLRSLIKPEAGRAIAYIDWEQQEFGIAGALSGDVAMMQAYESGDPYLAFAKQAGAVPDDATKLTHPSEREQFKTCALGVQYGMGEESLARSINQPVARARQLLELHRQTYAKYWRWEEDVLNHGMLANRIYTIFGWYLHVGPNANPRSLTNFPMQANGAEMLRLACCLMTERGIAVCASVHDAVLVEGPANEIEEIVGASAEAMAEASRILLNGFQLRTEAKIARHPDRYMDKRGKKMWETIMKILDELRVGYDGTGEVSHNGIVT